ncbi:MAG: lysophospholipid acyltransferase family protein [Planctomycetota bacterium]
MSRFFYSFSRVVLTPTFGLLYRLRVEGLQHLPREGPVVLVGNHASFLDPPVLGTAMPRPVSFLALEKFFRKPLLGSIFRAAGAIPIPQDGVSRDAFRTAAEVLRKGRVLGIFPEGGRTMAPPLDPFKEGAFRIARMGSASVIPVAILGTDRIWPRTRRLPRLFGRIRVILAPPIPAGTKPAEAMARAREAILERLTSA